MAVLLWPSVAEASQEKILYSFNGGTDGARPQGDLIAFRGIRYGTTGTGGGSLNCTGGCGTIYKIASGQVSVVYAFKGGGDGYLPVDGLLADSVGNLYGTTRYGGDASGSGKAFKITPDGSKSLLHAFAGGTDGENPNGDLIADAQGNLYGTTTYGGGADGGTVFKITPEGEETVLHSFAGDDGRYPAAGLIADAEGNLYGTTYSGGTSGEGTVFEILPGGSVTVLHSFQDGDDGAEPYCRLLADAEGNFYGTTNVGGANGRGTVFKLTPAGEAIVLHSFEGITALPFADLVADRQGNLYGNVGGGANGVGAIYKVTPDGQYSIVYDFGAFEGDGEYGSGRLIVDRHDNLFGTTAEGGIRGKGTIFKIKTSGIAEMSSLSR